jgi:hypothetical protein
MWPPFAWQGMPGPPIFSQECIEKTNRTIKKNAQAPKQWEKLLTIFFPLHTVSFNCWFWKVKFYVDIYEGGWWNYRTRKKTMGISSECLHIVEKVSLPVSTVERLNRRRRRKQKMAWSDNIDKKKTKARPTHYYFHILTLWAPKL